jgi:hypothetical protein
VTNRKNPWAAAAAVALLLGGGCRAKEPEGNASREELRRLMRGNVTQAKPPPPRLSGLAARDLGDRFTGSPACRLVHGADTLLVARDGAALVLLDGRLQAIPQAGPVDATGAFFRGPAVSISIGGRDPRAESGPAGVTIMSAGNDPPPQRFEGVWSCTG